MLREKIHLFICWLWACLNTAKCEYVTSFQYSPW